MQLVILGAGSFIRPYLERHFASQHTLYVGRNTLSHVNNIGPYILVSLAPLWGVADCLSQLPKPDYIVALGSTSVLSKAESLHTQERQVAARLAVAESHLKASGHPFSLLRCSMIYDGITDKNIARLKAHIARGFPVPLAGKGCGLRQPIHAQDVAAYVASAVQIQKTGTYTIAGGEILSFHDMCVRTASSVGRSPRFLNVPDFVLRAAGRWLPGAVVRSAQDQVYDVSESRALFPVTPRSFLP